VPPHVRRLSLAVLALSVGCLAFHDGPLPDEPRDATWAEIDGVRLRYTDSGGTGPAVVLLHGFASSLETWDTVVPSLTPTFRVVTLDLKGFGWSERPAGDYSPAAEAALVFGLLDRLGITQTAVVAHSWGSSVALAMAAGSPERVTKLALYDAWVYEDQLPTFFVWARVGGLGEAMFWLWYAERADDRMALAFYDQSYVTEDLVEAVERYLEKPGSVAAALAAVRGQTFDELEPLYGEVQVPTLLLWGREDRVVPLSVGERLAREIPRARLVVYPRCGHFPMFEAASTSTADLLSFLQEAAP
jgi:pimeloyl-ACP methyl ester carboxylesterase